VQRCPGADAGDGGRTGKGGNVGWVRTERQSERKRVANQANARRPRGRWAGKPERAALEEGKRLLREAIPEGARRLAALICDSATPPELFLQAFKLAADRAGLPPLTQNEVRTLSAPPVLLRMECPQCKGSHPLGWPEPIRADEAREDASQN
jgi:hypothetical protein